MKEKSIIVGINWEQNFACLMIDGRIVGAISEEDLRVKNDETYPKKAIEYLLKKNKVKRVKYQTFVLFQIFGLPHTH